MAFWRPLDFDNCCPSSTIDETILLDDTASDVGDTSDGVIEVMKVSRHSMKKIKKKQLQKTRGSGLLPGMKEAIKQCMKHWLLKRIKKHLKNSLFYCSCLLTQCEL